MNKVLTKGFYQQQWGEDGYYEKFTYGVGIDKVCEIALIPFLDVTKKAIEIGSGGGTFTERMIGGFEHLIAIDVIGMPKQFRKFENFSYIELPDDTYWCPSIKDSSIDFCFSYNCFCHLSNEALKEYIKDIHRVLRPGADFVFMLSKFSGIEQYLEEGHKYKLGDFTSMGHFYQDERTLGIIADKNDWQVVSENMIPEHRDIIVWLKKI